MTNSQPQISKVLCESPHLLHNKGNTTIHDHITIFISRLVILALQPRLTTSMQTHKHRELERQKKGSCNLQQLLKSGKTYHSMTNIASWTVILKYELKINEKWHYGIGDRPLFVYLKLASNHYSPIFYLPLPLYVANMMFVE